MTLADQNRERESGRGLFANSTFKRADEGVVLEVDGAQRHLTSEQIVAMFLLPLKNNANLEAGKPVECVFALPACAGKVNFPRVYCNLKSNQYDAQSLTYTIPMRDLQGKSSNNVCVMLPSSQGSLHHASFRPAPPWLRYTRCNVTISSKPMYKRGQAQS